MAGHDQIPDPGADLGAGGIKALQARVVDLGEATGEAGRGRDHAEQVVVVA